MDSETFIKLASAIITIVSILITTFLVPWLKTKIGTEKWNLLIEKTKMIVRAAKQIFSDSPEDNEKKKAYATTYITNVINQMNIKVSEDEVSNLIEGVYSEIKAAEGK